MTELEVSKARRAKAKSNGNGLVVLDLSGGRIFTVQPDGSDRKVIVTDCRLPDGVAVDIQAGHIYWTNMGVPNRNDGSIERVDFDGKNRITIVPEGATFTPKQLHLDGKNGKLYWCDREGMRVMRANLNGSNLETLIDSSQGESRPGRDPRKWCVGISVDAEHGQFYWTQKGPDKGNQGRIFRAGTEIPKGQNAANRSDLEVLFDGLPEPIDLELDLDHRVMYWTDRGDPPRGNTVNRAPMDTDQGQRPTGHVLVNHLMEGIGIALDLKGQRMFVTDLAGSIYSAKLDGADKKVLLFAQGNLSGIAYAELPVISDEITEAPKQMPMTARTTTVIDYIVQRLAHEGITECFGVAGDYAFPICDAVERNPNIKWIGCSNELNAAYAADGYARVRGAAMLSTTYAVGELSAINGVMGAKAERSLVFHVVGMPSYQNQRLRKCMHHTLGDGAFGNFINISAQAACCHAVINPDNCMIEMERVIAEARRNNQPAYIVVPSDYALAPVTPTEVRPVTLKSNEASLNKAVAAVAERLNSSKSVVALPAFTLSRLRLHKEARRLIEALGCPFATTSMEKCIIDESHPQFAGLYAGAVSEEKTRQIVEDAELVLDLGGVSLNDETTAGFSGRLDSARFVSIGLNDVRIGEQVLGSVRLADMLAALAKLEAPAPPYRRTPQPAPRLNGSSSDKITMDALYPRYAAFIRPGDSVVLESGSSSLGLPPMTLADDVQVHIQMLWGSIGWATGAAFGIALADPNRRTILITGEGSHQLTANEIGNMGRYGANPIIFVLNNGGYMVERALEPNPDWAYNDLAKWRYADLPRALGCGDWVTARVETLGELEAAMKAARESKSGAYIEVVSERMDMPKNLAFAHTRLKELYGETP